MKASVIITTYKRSTSLMDAIESCINQRFNDQFEIIVVDDNGLNSPYQRENKTKLSSYIHSKTIKYIVLDKNYGACHARNAGARYATGEYLLFLDDDDLFCPDKIQKQTSFLDEHKEYAAHACAFVKKYKGKEVLANDSQPIVGNLDTFFIAGNFYTPMLCIRHQIFTEVGGFKDIPRYQDIYFMYHLLASQHHVYASNEPLYILNEHDGDRITTKSIYNTHAAVDKLRAFVAEHRTDGSNKEYFLIQIRLTELIGTAYYSSSYLNRIKSITYWVQCYKLVHSSKYIVYIAKSLVPNSWIKSLERLKKKYA